MSYAGYPPTGGDDDGMQGLEFLNSDAVPPTPKANAPDWGKFGAAMNQAARYFAGDAPDPGAYARNAGEQLAAFGQQVGFKKMPSISNQAGAVAINPLNVASPLSRPGDMAIQALSRLYPR